MNIIDRFLNSITMYRLVMYFLLVLVGVAVIFGAFGILPYNPLAIIFSGLFLALVAWVVNGIIAKLLGAQPNSESVYISALILTLIITPVLPNDPSGVIFLAWAATLAMASKYILEIDKKHIFNPAAFGVAVTLLAFNQSASWWVGGNVPLMAFVIVGGLLILRKIQRFDLAATFFLFALVSDVVTHIGFGATSTIEKALLHTPIFFFATIMLTEPLTTPPDRKWRLAYGALVGVLFSPAIHVGSINSTPELALLVGNIFSYIVSPKGKRVLTLREKQKVSDDIYHFTFASDKKLNFRPGQYMEWTLAHRNGDGRGNRRYFTIASAPTEDTVQLGVKFHTPSSSFKKALGAMNPGDTMIAGALDGEFTLPRDAAQKLAFIAGGIGITPFRSMIKDLEDRDERRDAVLFYSNRNASEVAYRDVLDEAERKIGMRTFYITTGGSNNDGGRGSDSDASSGARLDANMIKRELPDYHERMFYISGTHAMTNAFRKTLRGMGVPPTHIRTDFFPGFT